MTARKCFIGKIERGVVSRKAGMEILDALDEASSARGVAAVLEREGASAEARQAAADVVARYADKAARQRELTQRAAIAQANALKAHTTYETVVGQLQAQGRAPRSLRFKRGIPTLVNIAAESNLYRSIRSLIMRDPHEVATWGNVDALSIQLRGAAHARIADVIESLRPKKLGLQAERQNELELLRALYGDTTNPVAMRAAKAIEQNNEIMRQENVAAGGRIPYRKNFRLPNPDMEPAKVTALGPDRFKEIVRAHVDRQDMLDFDTGLPLSDARFEQLLDETYQGYKNGWAEGPPTAAYPGKRMLANKRDVGRFFSWKNADSWQFIAENLGTHASPYETILEHIGGMTKDTAMMRILGPNPEAWKRFVGSMFDREQGRLVKTAADFGGSVGKATKYNRALEAQLAKDRHHFDAAWAEMTGLNDTPVHSELARAMSDVRSVLTASQMGSAIISSITDPALVVQTARFNGIPAMNVLGRAIADMGRPGAEIEAAQAGLIADSIAYTLGGIDKAMGETIRTGRLAKLGPAVIRASGLRRWTATLRNAFGLEFMAHTARERVKTFGALSADFREALQRYGIGSAEWDILRATKPAEPRPNALLLRPMDVADQAIRENYARMINTEMSYAVIERDPVARALLIGDSRPGTPWGEIRRGASMYRSFSTSLITMQFARALARGFDGRRLSHAAITFVAMTALGTLAMQAKQILAGKTPLSLDPTTPDGLRGYGAAILQGGGLGIFGDVFFVDQTRYGNSWAAVLAGPQVAAAQTIVGDFIVKNIQKAAKGEPTNLAGDALYVLGRITPGSNLWYARLAFQREVLDQLALMIDPQAPERFRRMEDSARRDFNQSYFWPPGSTAPTGNALGIGP